MPQPQVNNTTMIYNRKTYQESVSLKDLTPEERVARRREQRTRSRRKMAELRKLEKGDRKAFTPEELKARRADRQRAKRAKETRNRETIKLDKPKTPQPRKDRKLPIGRKEKPQPKRMKDRAEDPNKVKVKLKPGLWVMANPDYDIVELKTKYKIAI